MTNDTTKAKTTAPTDKDQAEGDEAVVDRELERANKAKSENGSSKD